jgi:hypothetical protein
MEDQATRRAESLPRTVTELLDLLAREREALEQAGVDLSDEALVATSGEWSVKDQLAHVAAWERRLIGEVRGDHVIARFGLDEIEFSTMNGDVLNATPCFMRAIETILQPWYVQSSGPQARRCEPASPS